MGATVPAIGLLERDAELAALGEATSGALAGSGSVVVIEGPAGIGKTRLLAAARDRAQEAGVQAVSARAGELERELGWGVVRELYDRALSNTSRRERSQLLSGPAGLASAVLGHGNGASLPSGADATAAGLHGLYWLTANLAERHPLLLAVDDSHWADPPSRRWLTYLGARVDELPVVLLVTARPAEPGADSELVATLATQRSARVMHPAPLSDGASEELIRAALERDPDPEFVRACLAATGGNPFLLRELVGELARDGVPPTAAESPRVLEMRPAGIARSVLVRLSRQPEAARELAAAVAVLGSRASLMHAAELAALDEASAAEAADALAAANILESGAPLKFRHPIVRTAVYEELPAVRRAQWHARAAHLLGDAGRPPDEVAVHLLAVEPYGDPSVVERLRAGAECALAKGAPQAGAAYLRRALSEPPSPETRVDVLRATGAAERRLGDPAATEHLREAFELATDPRTGARAAHELALALARTLQLRESIEMLETAIAAVPDDDRELALELEAELAALGYLDLSAAPTVLDRIGRLAEEVEEGRTPGERLVLAQLANQLSIAGTSGGRAAGLAERALGRGLLLAEQTADSPAFYQAVYVLILADRFDVAETALADALEDARTRGSAVGFGLASAVRSELAYRRGEVAASEAEARASIEALGTPLPNALGWLVRALVERGRLDAADAALAESPFGGELPNQLLFTNLMHARGQLRIAQGKTREGLDDFLEVGRRIEPLGPDNINAVRSGLDATVALAAIDEGGEARRRASDAVARARAWGGATILGMALRAQGLVEDGSQGIERLREAVSVLADSPARLEHTRALVDLGAAQRRAAQRRAAREPLRLALDLAHRCGALALAERARDELQASGARPRRTQLTGVDSLTPSERRIADMAAAGLRNKEIAQALFLSRKTVEMHLASAFRKLDIHSRDDLAAALSQSQPIGLVP